MFCAVPYHLNHNKMLLAQIIGHGELDCGAVFTLVRFFCDDTDLHSHFSRANNIYSNFAFYHNPLKTADQPQLPVIFPKIHSPLRIVF
jgi:hypothetical protein